MSQVRIKQPGKLAVPGPRMGQDRLSMWTLARQEEQVTAENEQVSAENKKVKWIAIALACSGCAMGTEGGTDWTPTEADAVTRAADDIERVFGVVPPVENLRRVEGLYDWVGGSRVYGLASPTTGLATIWVDEIAMDGDAELLRTTVLTL